MTRRRKPLEGLSLSSFAQPKALEREQAQKSVAPEVQQMQQAQQAAGKTGVLDLQPKVTVNVKILKQQQDWLRDTAQGIRDNNCAAVPASDRVYPQHLIQVAIDMLKAADVNWAEVHNAEELRQRLNL
ncbi:MAG: hypothetical protein ACFB5Z_08800 [Elainellaceae cyanobacterium]